MKGFVVALSHNSVACSDGGAGGARHTLAPKKRGGGERRRPTPAHVRTHTWCNVQMLESAQRTHSAWTRVRTRVRTYVWPAVQCALVVSRGRTAPTTRIRGTYVHIRMLVHALFAR